MLNGISEGSWGRYRDRANMITVTVTVSAKAKGKGVEEELDETRQVTTIYEMM